jgi:haloacid dehalogenase superfamily, subfamily IA, variant 1 with third motif having Dx(3-4)D or Dx(3-4)E
VRFKAVFFDAGETLVHPAPSFPELFAAVVTREGHPRTDDEVRHASTVITGRFSDAAKANELWTTSPERSARFWGSVYDLMIDALDLPSVNGLRDTLYAAFTDLSNYALFDDVAPALEQLRSHGVILGIVSNFEPWLDELLGALEVRDAFPVRVISGLEGVEKPDPHIYELAMERAGVSPEESAYVGDNPEFDVDPPAALGMFPVLIDRRNRHPAHPGVRLTDLAQLAEALA